MDMFDINKVRYDCSDLVGRFNARAALFSRGYIDSSNEYGTRSWLSGWILNLSILRFSSSRNNAIGVPGDVVSGMES